MVTEDEKGREGRMGQKDRDESRGREGGTAMGDERREMVGQQQKMGGGRKGWDGDGRREGREGWDGRWEGERGGGTETDDRRGREGELDNVVCQFHLIVCLQVRLDSNNVKCE